MPASPLSNTEDTCTAPSTLYQKPSRAGLAGFPRSCLLHPNTVTAPQPLELEAPPVTYKQGHYLKDMAPISNVSVPYEKLELFVLV